ncbi:hypothetical protein DM02DRAFT_655089 [Periconia macrospinosa]|uniref:Uncharacterized protein n=1 Tax=Periconia macrospinosa TaxID=97972 RepID=A0A2V1DRQ6_9PLEO|nr:hypothetical protein DM02DRAFT_655089 [Periconia macrospinosa]
MESYTPERMKDAISTILPSQITPDESPLSRKHTRNVHKRQTSSSSISSLSSSDKENENDVAPTERTPLLNLPQTPNLNNKTPTNSTIRPIASPSPLKNGNFEVEAEFLQAMMVVLEREANMNRNAGLTKHDIKKIVRKEVKKNSQPSTQTDSAGGPSTNDIKGKGKAEDVENVDDETKARAAIRSAITSLEDSKPKTAPSPGLLTEAQRARIRDIVREELAVQQFLSSSPRDKQLHEYINVPAIVGTTLGVVGIVLLKRLADRRPEEMTWALDGAGKAAFGVFGGLVVVKGLLWGLGRWWQRRREGAEGRIMV